MILLKVKIYPQANIFPSPTATSMLPVHRPRIALGEHSDTYDGTVAAIKPTPKPVRKREKNKTLSPTLGDEPMPAID